ncbi:MAG: hypothetical protein IJB35_00715, partial [Oscillospiraceae bacterium]|nr:hypothetical protein [Oscillospiraceae bacterium]
FLGILLLVFLFILANRRAMRLKKGIIWTFTMKMDPQAGALRATKTGAKSITGWGWKPMLLVPIDESHSVGGLPFRAVRSKTAGRHSIRRSESSFLRFKRQHPQVQVKGTPEYLKKFYRSDINETAAYYLSQIRAGGDMLLRKDSRKCTERMFFEGVGQLARDDLMEEKDGQKASGKKAAASQTVSYQISSGGCMIYSKDVNRADPNHPTIKFTVWVYEADKQSSSGSIDRSRFMKGKKKKSPKGK